MYDSERAVMRQVRQLIGQQLPELEKLEHLFEYLCHVRDETLEEYIKTKKLNSHQLNETVQELRAKIDELLTSPYATELLLLILPSLLDAKKAI